MSRGRRQFDAPRLSQDRWLVSYADLITLLFAFFVVMYSISQANDGDYRVLSNSISNAFTRVKPVISQRGASDQAAAEIGYPDAAAQTSAQVPFRPQDLEPGRSLARLEGALEQERQKRFISDDQLRVAQSPEGLAIEINATLLFPSGSAVLLARAAPVLRDLAGLLGPLGNAVRVEGYTDDVPIQNQRFASNWELSAARAASVVRVFEEHGVSSERLSVQAFGAQRAIADNSTEAGRSRNRRVVVNLLDEQPSPRPRLPGEYFDVSAGRAGLASLSR